jgi:hypothetical protein
MILPVVLEAVKIYGRALAHASAELKNNRDLAVKPNGSALRHVESSLRW